MLLLIATGSTCLSVRPSARLDLCLSVRLSAICTCLSDVSYFLMCLCVMQGQCPGVFHILICSLLSYLCACWSVLICVCACISVNIFCIFFRLSAIYSLLLSVCLSAALPLKYRWTTAMFGSTAQKQLQSKISTDAAGNRGEMGCRMQGPYVKFSGCLGAKQANGI